MSDGARRTGAGVDPIRPAAVPGRSDPWPLSTSPAGSAGCAGSSTRPDPTTGPVDSLLVTTPANIRWLSGFTGSAGLLLVTRDRAVLTTDGRYRTQSIEQLAEAGVGSDVEVSIGGVQAQREALWPPWPEPAGGWDWKPTT